MPKKIVIVCSMHEMNDNWVSKKPFNRIVIMKIKYPGQAVATSNLPSSHHHHGSLGLLYEANWTNANGRINQTPLSTYTKSNVNASSLGKYQRHLEQIKAYEIERGSDESPPRTVKDFHGYKPTTLKREKSLKQLNTWDDELKYKNIFHNPLYNHTPHNWHSSDYLNNDHFNTNNENYRPKIDPKIKRSQTVIVKQPTAQFNGNHIRNGDDVQGEFDLKDFYRRRLQLKQTEEKHQNRFQKSLSIHENHGDGGGSNSVNGINTNFTNGKHHRNCDSMSNRIVNDSFKFNGSSSVNLSKLALDDASNNRMNCYKIANFNASSENISNHHRIINEKILLNPLARNRSIKINHFDMVTASKKDQRTDNSNDDGRLCDINGNCEKTSLSSSSSSSSTKLKKKNSFSRMFYNTISAGSKFPRVFLGRTKSQRSKLNIEELNEQLESPNSTSSASTLSSTSYNDSKTHHNHNENNRDNSTLTSSNHHNHKVKSGSISSDSDSFLIPRPRLIVPVHLPRKRRTGNLVGDTATAPSEETNKATTLKTLKCDRKPTNRGNSDY